MIDPLLAVTILAIYFGGIATFFFAGLRPEIWQLRNAKTGFHDTYADKVNQLRTRAEYSLMTTIYESEKLREVFDRRESPDPDAPSLTETDRLAIEREIEGITSGLHDVTEPKKLFNGVCSDYDSQAVEMESFFYWFSAMSLVVPVVVIWLATVPDEYDFGLVILSLLILLITSGTVVGRWQIYASVRDRRGKERTGANRCG